MHMFFSSFKFWWLLGKSDVRHIFEALHILIYLESSYFAAAKHYDIVHNLFKKFTILYLYLVKKAVQLSDVRCHFLIYFEKLAGWNFFL